MLAGRAHACSVPVFRYALERWAPGTFELMVFNDRAYTPEHEQLLRSIVNTSANIEIRKVNLKSPAEEDLAVWKKQSNATAPWFVLRLPDSEVILRTGPVTADNLQSLIASPARAAIAKRLLAGESATWLIIQGKDAAANEATKRKLDEELARLARELKIPEIGPDDPPLRSRLPLAIRFSTLTVARGDAREAPLLEQLCHVDAKAAQVLANEKQPVVVPVIGRGRALAAVPADKLTPEVIERIAGFICGECSCEVKEQNPGMDLLIDADWNSIYEASADDPAPATRPTATTGAVSRPAAGTPVPIPPGLATQRAATAPVAAIVGPGSAATPGNAPSISRPLILAGIFVFALVALGALWMMLRKNPGA